MNKLEHLDEFNKALTNYEPSASARSVLAQSKLVLCSAASATGRNTIIRELIKTGEFYFIVSDTTRQPRHNDGVLEQNGREYWFRTELDMLRDIQDGKFVEAEVIHNQQVSGMSVREIQASIDQQKIAITDADRGGVTIVKAIKPDTVCIFFLPPNFHAWQERIRLRGDMAPDEYRRRMVTARDELQHALDSDFYHFVVNDNIADCVRGVQKIVHGNIDASHEAEGRIIAQKILTELSTTFH